MINFDCSFSGEKIAEMLNFADHKNVSDESGRMWSVMWYNTILQPIL